MAQSHSTTLGPPNGSSDSEECAETVCLTRWAKANSLDCSASATKRLLHESGVSESETHVTDDPMFPAVCMALLGRFASGADLGVLGLWRYRVKFIDRPDVAVVARFVEGLDRPQLLLDLANEYRPELRENCHGC